MFSPFDCRNIANLLINKLSNNGQVDQADKADASTELNLTGDREFLTSESAADALAPLMSEGSSISKVRPIGHHRDHCQGQD